MSPPGACFSSKRRGKCHHQYLCNYSSFIIKYRVPPLPVPAWGLSACETPSASNDGQSNTPYLAMSLGDLTGLMLHVGWTGSAPRKSTHIPGARKWDSWEKVLQYSSSEEHIIPSEWGRTVHTPWSISITCRQNVRVAGMNPKSEFGNH